MINLIQVYKTIDNTAVEYDFASLEKGSWINLTAPTVQELELVAEKADVMLDFLTAATDEEEAARSEIEPDQMLVLIDIPIFRSNQNYETLPLGIIITENYFITVCLEVNAVISELIASPPGFFDTIKRTRLLFQILFKSATLYLKYIRIISRKTDELERLLRQSMENQELYKMLDFEKSLTYFSASLRGNYILTERLLRLRATNQVSNLIRMFEEDEDFLEDVSIEYKQAIEMVEIYTRILSSMLDVFTNIISNNLSRVMRFLTSVTIILAIPTMVSSFWGMNVAVPLSDFSHGFLLICIFSFSVTLISAYFLWKKHMF